MFISQKRPSLNVPTGDAHKGPAGQPEVNPLWASLAMSTNGMGASIQRRAQPGVSSPDDPSEREAEAVAETIVSAREPPQDIYYNGSAGRPPVNPLWASVAMSTNGMGASIQREVQPGVSSPNDPSEREAEAVADLIASAAEMLILPEVTIKPLPQDEVQRQCAACEEEEREPLQRKASSQAEGAHEEGTTLDSLASARGGGHPLAEGVRQLFEPRLGADLSRVRIHTDGRSERLASALHATAFTRGSDIFFSPSTFDPGSQAGRRLLAHELVHTVQQGASPLTGTAASPSATVQAVGPVPSVQRAGKSASAQPKVVATPQLRIQWKGDVRTSLFTYLRHVLDTEEQAAKLTAVLVSHLNEFLVIERGAEQKVNREEFEKKAAQLKSFTLDTEVTQALLKHLHTDLAGLELRGQLAEEGEKMRLKLEGPDIPDVKKTEKEQKDERRKDRKASAVNSDWSVLTDAALAGFYLTLMGHFGGLALTDEVKSLAADGLSREEIEKVLGDVAKRSYFTGLFTQAYREFAAAGGKGLDAFKPLVERIIEQAAWGNPTAVRNLLKVGTGWPERGRVGIVHRAEGTLLYDELGQPLLSVAGSMMRDEGYIGTKQLSWGINISGISDPALKGILTSLKQQAGDPARGVVLGAQMYFDNMKYVNDVVTKGLAKEVVDRFEGMLPVVSLFMLGHGVSAVLMKSPPPWPAIGVALKGLLIASGYVLQLDFAGSILSRLLTAGYHLSRVQRDPNQQLTELSKYHVEQAASPLRGIVADVAAMVLLGKLMEALRGGKRCSLECNSPCDFETEGKEKGKGKGKAQGKGSIPEPSVKKPTAEAYKLVDEYTEGLRKLREAIEKKDDAGRDAAKAALDKIEGTALEKAGQEGDPLAQLIEHITTLTKARSTIERGAVEPGSLHFPIEQPLRSGRFVEGIGRAFSFLCTKLGIRRGMKYAEIEKKLGWPPTSTVPRPYGAVRLTWKLADGSLVHLDIPGPENESDYELNRHPHIALEAPYGDTKGLHMNEQGVGVPFDSTPAHIEVDGDGQLNYRLEPLQNAAAKAAKAAKQGSKQ